MALGTIHWSPDYKTERDMSIPSVAKLAHAFGSREDMEERRILEILRGLRPGQELRVVRDALGGPLGYRVYDVTEEP